MIVNEIAKLENELQPRRSSCLYPSSASACSSLDSGCDTLAIRSLRSEKVCRSVLSFAHDMRGRDSKSSLRQEPREDVLGAPQVLGHLAYRRGLVVAPQGGHQTAVLGVRRVEDLGRMGDQRDQLAHHAL